MNQFFRFRRRTNQGFLTKILKHNDEKTAYSVPGSALIMPICRADEAVFHGATQHWRGIIRNPAL
jgi:hypothetical protein